ncbi:MAG: UbiH/UbiF/VisC/COQ6 family ubiquinone biosynthesis hydroxylase [Gammaproteobacteria bacterium]|nr:UbiH/UbiF/VisC/COQ6 family ubiquinone biosynthesis hydroxylase [Gammaproteobacteria bacterium]
MVAPRTQTVYDVVIAGGGMVGAALGCALGDSGLKVAVLDQRVPEPPPAQGYDLRVSAVTLASVAIFQAVGVWETIKHRVAPVREMKVWDATGNGSIHFDAAEMGEPCLAYIIENSLMQSALIERLHHFTNVHYLCPVEIDALELSPDAAMPTLKDGRRLNTRLLVGADGAQSRVRELAGIERHRHPLNQSSIVTTVATEKPHVDTARQRFLPTGPLAFLPLPEPHTCSIVWSADTPRADVLMALDDVAFLAELQQALGDDFGRIQSIGPRAVFPLTLSHAKSYVAERLALIGDAAHTVHPLAGQGVNLGYLDAATLAEVLLDAVAEKKDIGTTRVLRRFERWRKGDNMATVSITGGFRYLFSNDLPGVRELRNIGLSLTDAATPIKNLIMRRASGLEGDLPKLARRAAS